MVRAVKKPLGLLTLAAATYFMVSGGPYGLENLIAKTGYGPAALIIVLVPILWSLPTALMVGELSAALPEDGGYYAWTRRALGPFWGFQEAWLSLAAAVFDMGIYPSLLVAYLAKLYPVFDDPVVSFGARAVVLASAVLVNLRGARAVGRSAEAVGLLLLAPFGVFTVIAVARPHAVVPHPPTHDWLGGIVVAMWNTMGWDNASTIAGEVSEPQRTYPRALGITLVLVVVGYLIPIGAAWWAGIDTAMLTTGGWASAGQFTAGNALRYAIVAGGIASAFAALTSLLMSYSRVVVALAKDRYLPIGLAPKTTGEVPRGAILAAGGLFSLSLALDFERLVVLDIVLYGASLAIEFVALVKLRVSEPELARPFRLPGGVVAAALLGVFPIGLILLAFARSSDDRIGGVNAAWVALGIVALGPIAYLWRKNR